MCCVERNWCFFRLDVYIYFLGIYFGWQSYLQVVGEYTLSKFRCLCDLYMTSLTETLYLFFKNIICRSLGNISTYELSLYPSKLSGSLDMIFFSSKCFKFKNFSWKAMLIQLHVQIVTMPLPFWWTESHLVQNLSVTQLHVYRIM